MGASSFLKRSQADRAARVLEKKDASLPAVTDRELFRKASAVIRSLYGKDARFREGQYEAIEATLKKRRTLVVQRTGWGKSLVYFVCTKLLRGSGEGVTIVVSPLLVLMDNQIEAAKKLRLRCEILSSRTKERHGQILDAAQEDRIDMIFTTPETLMSYGVQRRLPKIRTGLFVIDEAHCISDWGHDFRLEYCRLKEVLRLLPSNVPVLAVTATANDRVTTDLREQLGHEVYISRGPLSRDSLSIQVLRLPKKIERCAWMLENLPGLPGSGIVYCLTRRDCEQVAAFLNRNGIAAMPYYAREDDELNRQAEEAFRQNRIKAIVATVKLGMGYDKGDIAFVIHFQTPANIVSYYQQIGRAGRSIERAYVFLMSGQEDEDILNYFIETAFPTEEETDQVMGLIRERPGVTRPGLEAALNIRRERIMKSLAFLENDGFIFRDGSMYYLSPKPYFYDAERYEAIRALRRREMAQMQQLVSTKECLSRFIVNALDDKTARKCGKCANCLGRPLLKEKVSASDRERALEYYEGLTLPIPPRKLWSAPEVTGGGKIRYINQEGICLSRYGDPGYGELVKRDKYSPDGRFCDELVIKSAGLLKPLIREKGISAVTCVPSLRSGITADFSRRLAKACGIPFETLLWKSMARQQKEMENSAHQCANAFSSFHAMEGAGMPERAILVDDVVDSRWTLTVCGYRLMENGCREVFPFALADSGGGV